MLKFVCDFVSPSLTKCDIILSLFFSQLKDSQNCSHYKENQVSAKLILESVRYKRKLNTFSWIVVDTSFYLLPLFSYFILATYILTIHQVNCIEINFYFLTVMKAAGAKLLRSACILKPEPRLSQLQLDFDYFFSSYLLLITEPLENSIRPQQGS